MFQADDLSNAQPIVVENSIATLLLGGMVFGMRAPARQGGFVSPLGQRQQPSGTRPARESFYRTESIDAIQARPQCRGQFQVLTSSLIARLDLEDHRET